MQYIEILFFVYSMDSWQDSWSVLCTLTSYSSKHTHTHTHTHTCHSNYMTIFWVHEMHVSKLMSCKLLLVGSWPQFITDPPPSSSNRDKSPIRLLGKIHTYTHTHTLPALGLKFFYNIHQHHIDPWNTMLMYNNHDFRALTRVESCWNVKPETPQTDRIILKKLTIGL